MKSERVLRSPEGAKVNLTRVAALPSAETTEHHHRQQLWGRVCPPPSHPNGLNGSEVLDWNPLAAPYESDDAHSECVM